MTAPTGAPYFAPPQPPKKKHTVRNIFLVLLVLFILFVGGCMALIGGVANEIDNELDKQEQEDAQPGGPDNPLEITPGEAFEVSGFNYQAGWTVTTDQLGYPQIEGLKYENTREDSDGAFVEVKFWSGNEVLANADCSSEQAAVGTIVSLSCISADEMPADYDKITINDTF